MNLLKVILLASTFLILIACGGTPVKEKAPVISATPQIKQEIEKTPIEEIIAAYQQSLDSKAAITKLLDYAQTLQFENKCLDSDLIVYHLLNTALNNEQRAHTELLRSECGLKRILTNGKTLGTEIALNKIDVWLSNAADLSTYNTSLNQRIELASAIYKALTELYKDSINILAREYKNTVGNESNSILRPYRVSMLWQALSRQPPSYRRSLIRELPQISPYITLLGIVEDETLSDKSRKDSLLTWLTNNALLAEQKKLPQTIIDFSEAQFSDKNDIAVLLPLSGRLQSQGNAIKQGILSAYYERSQRLRDLNLNESYSLSFIDSGSEADLSQEALSVDFSRYGLVLGPLLKAHVKQLSDLLPSNLNRVHLNSNPQSAANISNNYDIQATYFALSPEQEAEELARLMILKEIRNPIIIFEDTSISTRMKNAFTEHWKSKLIASGHLDTLALSEVSFTDNKSMRIGITSALDVLQSEKRIKQLSGLTSEVVHSVTRNRRDVDGFVVFAKPQDLELLNPIIESSISLFSDKAVPVFATSYSYNHKYNKNSVRDLRNLVFIDMPFVQPQARESKLAKTVENLYNQPSSTFLRLFAFGYDALSIANNSLQLKLFEQVTKKGLSGELSVLKNGKVNRRLTALKIEDVQANGAE